MRYITSAFMPVLLMLFPLTAFASQTAPEEPLEKISWAAKLCGPMPGPMITGFVLLAAMIIITFLVSLMKGGNRK